MCKITPPQLLTAVAALLLGLFSRNECQAQSTDYEWQGADPSTLVSSSDTEEKTVFLYNVGKKKFLNRGGSWGTAAVLSDVGVEFTISGDASNGYTFQTKMIAQDNTNYNTSDNTYLNNVSDKQFFLDRKENDNNGKFTMTSVTDGYTITTKAGVYMAASKASDATNVEDETNAITAFSSAPTDGTQVWKIVTLKERKEAFSKTADNVKAHIPATFMMKCTDFARRNSDIDQWKDGNGTALVYATQTVKESTSQSPSSQSLSYYMGNGTTVTSANGAKWTMNVKGNNTLKQSVTPFKHGWYEVRCRAFSTSTSGTPVLYASVNGATSKTDAKTNYAEAAITKLASSDVPSSYVDADTKVNTSSTVSGSTYYPYEVVVRVYVPTKNEASEDEGSSSTYETCQSLTFGVKSTGGSDSDWLCVDNFEMEYQGEGTNAIILDEMQPNIDYLNEQVSGKNSTIYLNRSLTANAWNSILLPFDMSQNDIINIFGSGTLVSKYVGAKDNDKTTIHFEQVTTIEAGKLYIIKPTVGEPNNGNITVSSQKELTLATMDDSGNVTTNDSKSTLTLSGNYYTIPNIVFGSLNTDNTPKKFDAQVTGETNTVVSGGEQYTFAGTYVKKMKVIPVYSYRINALSEEDHTGSTGNWVVNTDHKAHSLGFRGWLQKTSYNTSTGAAALSFVIDGIEDGTTAIDGITADDLNAPAKAVQGIYTLSGQRVNGDLQSLPRGLYIVNGRKVVVK